MDRYQKVKVLGKGSFGSAVLIKRKSDGQLLVVKEVNMLRMNSKEKEEARHEVKVLQKLQHPNITQFVERIERKGMLYIVMEYADGGDLHQKVEAAKRTRGFMKEELVLHYFSQLCLALDYLHSQHILHRDIKSMNVFLTSGGTVKLGDFGISTVLRNTLGMANTVCGTPYYFSPELCKNKPYNNKSDVWAMGIILYELVTLRHAFDGNSMQQLLQRITKGSFAPVPANVNPGIRDMITMCLQKDPNKRPTIKQLLMHDVMRSALSKLQSDLDSAAAQQKALREVIPRDPQVDDEAQRVLKAKLAGERAAKAMAEQQKAEQLKQQQQAPPPLQPLIGVKAGGNAGQMPPQPGRYAAYEQALANHRAGGGNNKVPPPSSNPAPAPYGGAGAAGAGRGGAAGGGNNNIDVKAVMGDLDMFLKHLGRPTDQIAKEAMRRDQVEKAHKDRARQGELEKERLERDKQEKMRLWEERQKKEKERLKEAAARAKAYQAELDSNLDKHRERMKAAQEKERIRREELKKKVAAQEKKKEQARKRANSNAAANLVKERAAQEAREAEKQRLKLKAAEEQRAVLKANLKPQVDKVQNWAAKQNEKNRRELEEKRQRKLEEDRRAVQELDARGIPEKDMKHKVLDPELEAWVNREIKKSASGDSAETSGHSNNNGAAAAANAKGKAQAEDLRHSIEKADLLFKERGEGQRNGGRTSPQLAPLVAPSGAPHVPGLQLAANACGSPLSVRNKPRHNELPHMNQQPHSAKAGGAPMQRAQTNDPTAHALFPPGAGFDPRSRSEDNIATGVGALQPTAARGERKEADPDMPEAFLAKPKLARSHSMSQPPEEIPASLAPPQQQVRHLSPGSGAPMQGGPVAGRRMADRRPNAQIDKLALQPDEIKKVAPKPTQPSGVERKKSFGRREGREGSAPPVMRTPEANKKPMHLDASASEFVTSPSNSHMDGGVELDAESKMVGVEHIPTPVRQWMNEPMGNNQQQEQQRSKLSAATAGNSNTSSNLAPPSNLSAQSASSAGTGAHPHDRSRTLTPPRAIVQGGGGVEEDIEEEITGGAVVQPAHPDPSIVIGAAGEEEIVEEVGEFENARADSEDDVDLNPIVEVQASSPQAVKKQQTEYSLMRSHIQDLLTASQLALSGVPQEESILDESPSFVPTSARGGNNQPVPTTRTSTSTTGGGPSSEQQAPAAVPSSSFLTPPKPISGLNHPAPVTPPAREEVGPRRHSMSAKSFIEDEQFGDAEPITPSAIRKAVPGRRRPTVTPSDAKKVRKKSQRSIDRGGTVDAMEETGLDNDDELEEVVEEDSDLGSNSGVSSSDETGGVTNTADNTDNTHAPGDEAIPEEDEDEAETALQRVAAICGEAFSGDYPCHMDGSPLFESALERGKGHSVGHKTRQAELLREYLEEVLGLSTLTSCYTIIGKLLEAPEPIPKGLNEKDGEEALMMSYTKHMGGVIGKATKIILDHLGDEAASDSLIDESVTLVAQLVYFDAEAFSHSN